MAQAHLGVQMTHDTPNHTGGLATKVFEYFFLSVPVLMSDMVDKRKIYGSLVDYAVPDNPQALAVAIKAMADDCEKREISALASRKIALKAYSWEGDMALIGPRPILPRMLPFMTTNERRRFLIRPGVTGLAQVKGRNFLKWSRRFRFDVIYQERMSIGMDLYILMQTVKIVLRSTGVAPDANPDQVDDVTNRTIMHQTKGARGGE